MKKSDLENGMIVEMRDGEKYIVIKDFTKKSERYGNDNDILLNIDFGSFEYLGTYKEDLTITNKENDCFDIVKVYCLINCGSNKEGLRLLWGREDDIKLIEKQINILSKFYKINDYDIIKDDDEYKILINLNEDVEVETYISDKTIKGRDEYNIYHFIESSIRLSILRQYFKR